MGAQEPDGKSVFGRTIALLGGAASVVTIYASLGGSGLAYTAIGGGALAILYSFWNLDRDPRAKFLLDHQSEVAIAEQRAVTERSKVDGLGFQMMHRAAEGVRLAAMNPARARADLRKTIDALLGTRLREFLKARLGTDAEYSVTVKWRRTPTTLVSIYRDETQPSNLRPEDDVEESDGHYFGEGCGRLVNAPDEMRCLVVHETQHPKFASRMRHRAEQRGYNSCLSIPLNLPLGKAAANLGFLSIDSRKKWAFAGLFDKKDESYELGVDGTNHSPKADMHLLYGLADSLATILALTEPESGSHEKVSSGSRNPRDDERGAGSGTDA